MTLDALRPDKLSVSNSDVLAPKTFVFLFEQITLLYS